MRSSVNPPEDKNSFTCPHCGTFAKHSEHPILEACEGGGFTPIKEYEGIIRKCPRCNNLSYWVGYELVYPFHSGIRPNEYMPDDIAEIFKEAQSVLRLSPRSACVLLRHTLERLVKGAGGKGHNLVEMIDSLGLPEKLKRVCTTCRIVGNDAAHGELFSSFSKDELIEDGEIISALINHVTEELYGIDAAIAEIRARHPKVP